MPSGPSRFHFLAGGVVGRQRLQELVSEIDPKQMLDEDVEEVGLFVVLLSTEKVHLQYVIYIIWRCMGMHPSILKHTPVPHPERDI